MSRILVIEDDPDIRELYRRRLEMAGHQVVEAPDGNVGTRLYKADPADIVITDIIMPEKDGVQTIMELKKAFPDARIIAVSGGGKAIEGPTCLRLAGHLGAQRTLSKPIQWGELAEAIHELMQMQPSVH